MFRHGIVLACLFQSASPLAQLRSDPAVEPAPAAPLIFRDAGEESTESDVEQTVIQLREQLRAIAADHLTAAEEKDALGQVLSEHPLIFPVGNTEAASQPATGRRASRR